MTRFSPFFLDENTQSTMLSWAQQRINAGPDPKSGARSVAYFEQNIGNTVTDGGLGWEAAFRLFTDEIVPSTRPFDHPTSLSFVAAAPSPAALSFDAALGAAEIFAGNWDGGSGAIYAENQAIAWLAGLAGWPDSAGGVFVSGGTLGNLSALHAARVAYRGPRPSRLTLVASNQAHSSIEAVAKVMDVELVLVASDADGCIDIDALRTTLANTQGVFALIANAGATNCGAVDNIAAMADLAEEYDAWLHVDGAYGLAALASKHARRAFDGIERADSFIVDPHKWLFAPYDSCGLLYRDPARAAQAHGQQGAYLDTLSKDGWNPSDFALQLTRRARGLPFWFSLATYGQDAYAAAIDKTLSIAREIAQQIAHSDGLDLILGPQLSVILFRAKNRSPKELADWAEENRRSGALLCLPTTWQGESVLRICVVNPATKIDEVMAVLRTLA